MVERKSQRLVDAKRKNIKAPNFSLRIRKQNILIEKENSLSCLVMEFSFDDLQGI
jgi:hypothetical protein